MVVDHTVSPSSVKLELISDLPEWMYMKYLGVGGIVHVRNMIFRIFQTGTSITYIAVNIESKMLKKCRFYLHTVQISQCRSILLLVENRNIDMIYLHEHFHQPIKMQNTPSYIFHHGSFQEPSPVHILINHQYNKTNVNPFILWTYDHFFKPISHALMNSHKMCRTFMLKYMTRITDSMQYIASNGLTSFNIFVYQRICTLLQI